jgi:hypothetical protein
VNTGYRGVIDYDRYPPSGSASEAPQSTLQFGRDEQVCKELREAYRDASVEFEEAVNDYGLSIGRARFDLDNDGNRDTVYLLSSRTRQDNSDRLLVVRDDPFAATWPPAGIKVYEIEQALKPNFQLSKIQSGFGYAHLKVVRRNDRTYVYAIPAGWGDDYGSLIIFEGDPKLGLRTVCIWTRE